MFSVVALDVKGLRASERKHQVTLRLYKVWGVKLECGFMITFSETSNVDFYSNAPTVWDISPHTQSKGL